MGIRHGFGRPVDREYVSFSSKYPSPRCYGYVIGLVGGFNPVEKYANVKMGSSSPIFGVKIKHI